MMSPHIRPPPVRLSLSFIVEILHVLKPAPFSSGKCRRESRGLYESLCLRIRTPSECLNAKTDGTTHCPAPSEPSACLFSVAHRIGTLNRWFTTSGPIGCRRSRMRFMRMSRDVEPLLEIAVAMNSSSARTLAKCSPRELIL